jgi:hypothetical protein
MSLTGQRPTPGGVLDELIQNPRRLGIATLALGSLPLLSTGYDLADLLRI